MSVLSGANLGPPGKPHQLEDSYSPYNMMSSSESPTSPLVPQDSWGQGKSSTEKMANGTNINWPPGKYPSRIQALFWLFKKKNLTFNLFFEFLQSSALVFPGKVSRILTLKLTPT